MREALGVAELVKELERVVGIPISGIAQQSRLRMQVVRSVTGRYSWRSCRCQYLSNGLGQSGLALLSTSALMHQDKKLRFGMVLVC